MAVVITRTPWIDDDGSGTTGTVLNNSVKTDLYNQIDAALAQLVPATGGAFTPVPYVAGNFVGATGAWTVEAADVNNNRYQLRQKVLEWAVWLNTTTVASGQTELRITLPGGLHAAVAQQFPGIWTDSTGAAVADFAVLSTPPGATYLQIFKKDFSAWPSGANVVGIRFTCAIEIQ